MKKTRGNFKRQSGSISAVGLVGLDLEHTYSRNFAIVCHVSMAETLFMKVRNEKETIVLKNQF